MAQDFLGAKGRPDVVNPLAVAPPEILSIFLDQCHHKHAFWCDIACAVNRRFNRGVNVCRCCRWLSCTRGTYF